MEALLCAAIMAVVQVIILCKLMEAAGHGIVLLQEQNEDSKRMIDLLEKQSPVEKGFSDCGNNGGRDGFNGCGTETGRRKECIDAFIEDLREYLPSREYGGDELHHRQRLYR